MRRILALLVLAAVPAALHAQGRPETNSSDVDTFLARLDQLSDRLRTASPADVPAIAADVPSTWRIRTGPDEVRVPFEPLVQRLIESRARPETWTAVRAETLERVAAMRAEIRARADPDGNIEASELRALRDGVLARPEFARAARRGWAGDLRDMLGNWLRDLWGRLGGDRLNSRLVAQGVAWLAVLVAVVSILWFLQSRMRRVESALRITDGSGPATPSREWAQRALAAARAGDSREAVRCAYRAAVRRIEEQGVWRADEARTPREYGALLQEDDARGMQFRAIAGQFERAWYGRRLPSPDELDAVTDSLERLGCLRVHERAI